jgi:hypothetical protein
MRFIVVIPITLLLTLPAMSVELFRYRGTADDGGRIDYIFETDDLSLPKTVSEEKVAEIAADWMTTFYQVQTGVLESQEFRTSPISEWLICFTETVQGPIPTGRREPQRSFGRYFECGSSGPGS